MPSLLNTKRRSHRKSSLRSSRRKSLPFKDVNSKSDLTQWLYNNPSIALQLFTSVFSMYKSTTNSSTIKTILEKNMSIIKDIKRLEESIEAMKKAFGQREDGISDKRLRVIDEQQQQNQNEADAKLKATTDDIEKQKAIIESVKT